MCNSGKIIVYCSTNNFRFRIKIKLFETLEQFKFILSLMTSIGYIVGEWFVSSVLIRSVAVSALYCIGLIFFLTA